jgi:protein phosphatase-4 regulatory subunit 3
MYISGNKVRPCFSLVFLVSLSPETLIVWTEPNGADYALSFQDPEGCSEVWNFICDVQQHITGSDEHTLITSSPVIGPEPSTNRGQLPTPQLGIIPDIERSIKGLSRQGQIKERLCEYIMQEVRAGPFSI